MGRLQLGFRCAAAAAAAECLDSQAQVTSENFKPEGSHSRERSTIPISTYHTPQRGAARRSLICAGHANLKVLSVFFFSRLFFSTDDAVFQFQSCAWNMITVCPLHIRVHTYTLLLSLSLPDSKTSFVLFFLRLACISWSAFALERSTNLSLRFLFSSRRCCCCSFSVSSFQGLSNSSCLFCCSSCCCCQQVHLSAHCPERTG